jgi:hypothetical protein
MAEMPDRGKVNGEIHRIIGQYRNGTGAIPPLAETTDGPLTPRRPPSTHGNRLQESGGWPRESSSA